METRYYEIADSLLKLSAENFDFADTFSVFEKELSALGEKNDAPIAEIIDIQCACEPCPYEYLAEILCAEDMKIGTVEGGYLIQYQNSDTVTACVLKDGDRSAIIYLKSPQGGEAQKNAIRDAFLYFIQKDKKIAIHSASFIYRGKAWLFSAPSGVGKSTHVKLWHSTDVAIEDLNGDIAICYQKSDGTVVAASSPWCGTSGIYSNHVAVLGGVIFLKQGQENKICTYDLFEASLRLAARCISPAWTKELVQTNLSCAEEIARRIRLAGLQCLPNPEAALIAKRYIDTGDDTEQRE